MEINRENVLTVCRNSNIHPDKDYGQNFLIEPNASSRIVSLLDIEASDHVLEIGPGIGSLSHFLLESNAAHIDLDDIDPNMIYFLNVFYKNERVSIIEKDARKLDVNKYDKIVSNLPYNITSEMVIYLLCNAKNAKKFVFMCQSEAFNHFNDIKGKEYGPSSVLVRLMSNIKSEFKVGRGSFYPVPKVDSTVFTITRKECDFEKCVNVYKLSKALFLNRRKTIHNNLSSYLKDKDKSLEVLSKLNLESNLRPEQISPNDYLRIYELLNLE